MRLPNPAALRSLWGLQQEAVASRSRTKEQLRAEPRFRAAVEECAARSGLTHAEAFARADGYLEEMVSAHSDAFPEFSTVLARVADRRGFEGVVECDDAALERLEALDADHSLVVTTAHRSYMDFVVRVPFARRGFAREFRFAGANILFWPMGPVGHAFGIIYIRRGFRDPLYTVVLRQYVGWLTEQRSNFLWALEGGRTRTGKQLAPKAGLLAYVADAYVEGRAPEIMLVPATVVYEYLNEVFEYAAYGRGATKAGESLLSNLKLARAQRKVPDHAKIIVAIGEPVGLGEFLDRTHGRDTAEFTEGVSRAAREASRRIDAATPITSVALVLLPLLQRHGARWTVDELVTDLAPWVATIERRGLPTSGKDVGGAQAVTRALGLLLAQGLLTREGTGAQASYTVRSGRHLEAAFYRNGLLHHFLIRSIVELALVLVQSHGSVPGFWSEVERLRDLLSREFTFPEGEDFPAAVRAELEHHDPRWQLTLESEAGGSALLEQMGPVVAPRVLGALLEAYQLVADRLCRRGGMPVVDERAFLLDCLAHAQLEVALGRIRRPDAASLNLFDLPLKLARDRGLLSARCASERRLFGTHVASSVNAVAALEERQPAV